MGKERSDTPIVLVLWAAFIILMWVSL